MIRSNGSGGSGDGGGGGGSRRCRFEDIDTDAAGQHRRGRLRGGSRRDNVVRRNQFRRSRSSDNDTIVVVVVTPYYDYDYDGACGIDNDVVDEDDMATEVQTKFLLHHIII